MNRRIVGTVGALAFLGGAVVLSYAISPLIGYYVVPGSSVQTLQDYRKSVQGRARPSGNRLVVPKIRVDTPIVEGDSEEALSRGAWRDGNSGKPGQGKNIVVSGHRFQYLPPNNKTFYLLDKLSQGELIVIRWQDRDYGYTVSRVFEVGPNDVSILNPGNQEKLTLYSCTPLFTQDRRLVVEALPVN